MGQGIWEQNVFALLELGGSLQLSIDVVPFNITQGVVE